MPFLPYYVQELGVTELHEVELWSGFLLAIQADGKGVPMVRETSGQAHESVPSGKVRLGKGEKRTKKKEAIVTGIYTIEPNPRTPEEVVASFFHKDETPVPQERTSKRSKPQNKQLWATLQGKDVALERLARQVNKREGRHIEHRIALTDGAEALQVRVLNYCPDFTLILDFIHADEYLWDVPNRLFDEKDPQRTAWVEARTLECYDSATACSRTRATPLNKLMVMERNIFRPDNRRQQALAAYMDKRGKRRGSNRPWDSACRAAGRAPNPRKGELRRSVETVAGSHVLLTSPSNAR